MSSFFVPFNRRHIEDLVTQEINLDVKDYFSKEFCADLEKGDSFTLLYNDQIMVCGGVGRIWPGRGHLWAIFNQDCKKNFLPIFRSLKLFMKHMLTHYHRLELSVDYGPWYELASRRAELLGFKLETLRAKKYLPTGEDCAIYTLVRE